jgi:hypothetical protein
MLNLFTAMADFFRFLTAPRVKRNYFLIHPSNSQESKTSKTSRASSKSWGLLTDLDIAEQNFLLSAWCCQFRGKERGLSLLTVPEHLRWPYVSECREFENSRSGGPLSISERQDAIRGFFPGPRIRQDL